MKQIHWRMQHLTQHALLPMIARGSRGKILLNTSHFLESPLNIWVGTLSQKACSRWPTFGLLQYCHFYEFRNKGSSNISVKDKKVSARGICIHECQWYTGFALHLNKVKLLVLWVGFLSSENENRPYIVIHITFFGMRWSLSFSKNTVLRGIT